MRTLLALAHLGERVAQALGAPVSSDDVVLEPVDRVLRVLEVDVE